MDLGEMFARTMASADQNGSRAPRADHKTQIIELKDRAQAYINWSDIPYKPGDLITPRIGTMLKAPGEPHIVLEVNPKAEPMFGIDPDSSGNPNFGNRHNIRVLSLTDVGNYLPYWCEAAQFEPYIEEK